MSLIAEKPLTETTQKVQLVKGEFSCSDASFIVNELIDRKINFHKFERMRVCEGNEKSDTSFADCRITELQNEKQIAKDYISKARSEGYDVSINGVLEIKFTKK